MDQFILWIFRLIYNIKKLGKKFNILIAYIWLLTLNLCLQKTIVYTYNLKSKWK